MGIRSSQHIKIVKGAGSGELTPLLSPEALFLKSLKIPYGQIRRDYLLLGGSLGYRLAARKDQLNRMDAAFQSGSNPWEYHRKFMDAVRTVDGKLKLKFYEKDYLLERITSQLLKAELIRRQGKGFALTDFGRWFYENDRTNGDIFPLGLFDRQRLPGGFRDLVGYSGTQIEDYHGQRLLLNMDLTRTDPGYSALLLESNKNPLPPEHKPCSVIEGRKDPFFRTPAFAKIEGDLQRAGTADLQLCPVGYQPQFDHVVFTVRHSDGTRGVVDFPRKWHNYLLKEHGNEFKLLAIESELKEFDTGVITLRNGKSAVAVAGYDNHIVAVFSNMLRPDSFDYRLKKIEKNLSNWYSGSMPLEYLLRPTEI